jgi:hypothetical protein
MLAVVESYGIAYTDGGLIVRVLSIGRGLKRW